MTNSSKEASLSLSLSLSFSFSLSFSLMPYVQTQITNLHDKLDMSKEALQVPLKKEPHLKKDHLEKKLFWEKNSLQSKEPYTLSKKPCVLWKTPCIASKEPYV